MLILVDISAPRYIDISGIMSKRILFYSVHDFVHYGMF